MKYHDSDTLELVNQAVAAGRRLKYQMEWIKDVDTDALCRQCGWEALRLDSDLDRNKCTKCGHVQTDDEVIVLSDHLWPQ